MYSVAVIGTGVFGRQLRDVIAHNVPMVQSANHCDVANPPPHFTSNLASLTADVIVIAIKASFVEEIIRQLRHIPDDAHIVIASKGTDDDGDVLSKAVRRIAVEQGKSYRVYVLSGGSYASSLAEGDPTAVDLAGETAEDAARIAKLFQVTVEDFDSTVNKTGAFFYPHPTADIVGVESLGVSKNVVVMADAILAAANVTIDRRQHVFGLAIKDQYEYLTHQGGKPESILSYAGIGDLGLTRNPESRNWFVVYVQALAQICQQAQGVLPFEEAARYLLGIGRDAPLLQSRKRQTAFRVVFDKLEDMAESGVFHATAEGARSAPRLVAYANKHDLKIPLMRAVHQFLEGGIEAENFYSCINVGAIEVEGAAGDIPLHALIVAYKRIYSFANCDRHHHSYTENTPSMLLATMFNEIFSLVKYIAPVSYSDNDIVNLLMPYAAQRAFDYRELDTKSSHASLLQYIQSVRDSVGEGVPLPMADTVHACVHNTSYEQGMCSRDLIRMLNKN